MSDKKRRGEHYVNVMITVPPDMRVNMRYHRKRAKWSQVCQKAIAAKIRKLDRERR